MTLAQKDTLIYVRNGLLQIVAIVAFAYIFGQAVSEWNADAVPVTEAPPECTPCGCTTETKSVNIKGNSL